MLFPFPWYFMFKPVSTQYNTSSSSSTSTDWTATIALSTMFLVIGGIAWKVCETSLENNRMELSVRCSTDDRYIGKWDNTINRCLRKE